VSIASLGEEIKKRTVIVHGVAKSYAMTGWRIGFAAGPEEVIAAMSNIQSQSTSNPNSIAQKASIEGSHGFQDEVMKMVSAFAERRAYIVDRLNTIPGCVMLQPVRGLLRLSELLFHLWQIVSGAADWNSTGLANYLLDAARVAVVPGIDGAR